MNRRTHLVPASFPGASVIALLTSTACTSPSDATYQMCAPAGRCFTIIGVTRQQGDALPQVPVANAAFTVISYASKTGTAPLAAATAEADSVAALAVTQRAVGSDPLLAIDQVTSSELTGPFKEGRMYYYRVRGKSVTRFDVTKPAPAPK